MNVLVTGGAGYLGTELIGQLVANPAVNEVVVYDNLSRPNYNLFLGLRLVHSEKLKFVKGELLDSRALKKVLKGIDVVYHLAAKVSTPFANEDAHVYEQVNHWGTAELVYAVEESDVRRFIFTSSTGVYGASEQFVNEETQPDPRTFYAISKQRGEEHVRRLAAKRDTFIVRCGNVYGYNKSMRFDGVINKFVFDANFSNRITIQGNGKQSRSFIHIEKAGKALNNLLTSSVEPGTYNLVEKNIAVIELLDVLKDIKPSLEFIFINQHLRLPEIKVAVNQAFNTALGIQETRALKDELQEFLKKFAF